MSIPSSSVNNGSPIAYAEGYQSPWSSFSSSAAGEQSPLFGSSFSFRAAGEQSPLFGSSFSFRAEGGEDSNLSPIMHRVKRRALPLFSPSIDGSLGGSFKLDVPHSEKETLPREAGGESRKESSFIDDILQIHSTNKISHEGASFSITPRMRNGEIVTGDHTQIFEVNSAELIIPGKPNEEVLVKLYRKDVLDDVNRLNFPDKRILKATPRAILSWKATSKEQYDNFVRWDIPVAKTFLDTDSFLVVEKVNPIEMIPWKANTEISALTEKDHKLLNALINIATVCLDPAHPSDIGIDMSPGNIGEDADGRFVIFDFMEHREDEDTVPLDCHASKMNIRKHFRVWANGNPRIHEHLCAPFLRIDPDLHSFLSGGFSS